jgi:hypothetical protein
MDHMWWMIRASTSPRRLPIKIGPASDSNYQTRVIGCNGEALELVDYVYEGEPVRQKIIEMLNTSLMVIGRLETVSIAGGFELWFREAHDGGLLHALKRSWQTV